MNGTDLNAAWARRGGRRQARHRVSADGRLKVYCWCGAHVLRVDRNLILAGRTGSCGQFCYPGCPVVFAEV